MNRLETLKTQYPEFNISIFDILNLFDTTGKYKYIQLFCQLFKNDMINRFDKDKSLNKHIHNKLKDVGVNYENLPKNQSIILSILIDFLCPDHLKVLSKFVNHMENNRIDVKDITSYKSFDEINLAISKAEFKEIKKSLQNQVIKEFENDDWLVIRPLTMESSKKYGANTKWCTTSDKDDFYFYKHLITGILVYFLNKKTGYKFAGFKDFSNNELSFWNSADLREDSLSLNIDGYMYDEIRKIFSSTKPNIEFCDNEQHKVAYEVYGEMYDDEGIRRIPTIEDEAVIRYNESEVPGPPYEYAGIDMRRVHMAGVHQIDVDDEDFVGDNTFYGNTNIIPIYRLINSNRENLTNENVDYMQQLEKAKTTLAKLLNDENVTNTFPPKIDE